MTTAKKYAEVTMYKGYGHSVKLYPYMWYDLRWIYEKPAFFIYRFFSKNSLLNARNPINIATKIAIVVTESVIGFFVVKLLNKII